jgi:hypothetical protein
MIGQSCGHVGKPCLRINPRTGARCITFGAHCYFDAIYHNEKLVANILDLDRGCFVILSLPLLTSCGPGALKG